LRWKLIAITLFCVCLHQAHLVWQKTESVLTVTFFDVGQGDAVLLETPDGKHVLYDTGILSFNQNTAERVLLPELKARNIKQLDAVILSHPHSDHIGGITTLIQQIPVKVIYESGLIYDSVTYRTYRTAAVE